MKTEGKEYCDAKKALKTFIERHRINVDLENKDIEFFVRYSILKTSSKSTDLFKDLDIKIDGEIATYSKYFSDTNKNTLREEIKIVYDRYQSIKNRTISKDEAEIKEIIGEKDKADEDKPVLEMDFSDFLNWWSNQEKNCYYCGIDEKTTDELFKKELIKSKKRSFTGKLQIDRKDPNKGYNNENCVFACVLCNNAKSDMISEKDFKEIIAPPIRVYWNLLKKKGDKKE